MKIFAALMAVLSVVSTTYAKDYCLSTYKAKNSPDICYWENGRYGQDISCGEGFVARGACGSGQNPDCRKSGKYWTSLYCCYNPSTVGRRYCHSSTGSLGQQLDCSSEKAAFGICGSGKNANCGKNIWNKLVCCRSSLRIDVSTCDRQYGKWGTYLSCGTKKVMTGMCGSGTYANCPNKSWHGITCCKIA